MVTVEGHTVSSWRRTGGWGWGSWAGGHSSWGVSGGAGPLEVSDQWGQGPALWEAGTANPYPPLMVQRAEEAGGRGRVAADDTKDT